MQEGFWTTQLRTWWPKGFDKGTTRREHMAGARRDWKNRSHTFQIEHKETMEMDRGQDLRQTMQSLQSNTATRHLLRVGSTPRGGGGGQLGWV